MFVLQEYHLIFMIVSIFLYLICLFIIFSKPEKSEVILAIVLASTNIYFSYLTALGFFQIGLVGVDIATGNAIVSGYEEMAQFYMVFFGMLMINVGIIIYGFLKLIKMNLEELAQGNSKKRWRDDF
jgi:D-alanyl-lipoteichoic acid acyltransferase DltB (MBOAT superfamily)